MQFKNPLILYALFLLLIPVVVHLFQLRRFKKTTFSNVAFLTSISKQTRKSARLKKFLILCTRLLAMGAFIMAFAQPFLPHSDTSTLARETVVFIDNSFSMQAKGTKGTLLTEAIQDLIKNMPTDFTLITYTRTYPMINVVNDHNTLLAVNYAPTTLTPDELALKINNAFSGKQGVAKELVFISDFNDLDTKPLEAMTDVAQHWVILNPATTVNATINKVDLDRKSEAYLVHTLITTSTTEKVNIPVSLYNGDKLISRATANFNDSTRAKIDFRIPLNTRFLGRLHLDDAGLGYDNDFYFSLDKPAPLKILSINQAPDVYLKRLYNESDFTYAAVSPQELSYDQLTDQQVIILNELKTIPTSLVTALQPFRQNGGKTILIPANNVPAATYDDLLGAYGVLPFGEKTITPRNVTAINYDHPLYRNVFERRAANFQYPSISTSFMLRGNTSPLNYADGSPFLLQGNGIYVFSGALDSANSNFQESPLIVPTFGEMARSALALPRPYYFIGERDDFEIKSTATGDDVYSLRLGSKSFIPLQEKKGGTVRISVQQGLDQAGIYEVVYKDSVVGHVAYNYTREESRLRGSAPQKVKDISQSNSVNHAINEVQQASSLNLLYKWFIIFALLFLLSEMLILKFFK